MTIYEALAKVYDEVRYIRKTGYNDFHKYSYVEESAVKETFHRAFQRHGILFLPSVETIDKQTIVDSKGKEQQLVTMHLSVAFMLTSAINEKIAEEQVARAYPTQVYRTTAVGQGVDAGDKAVNKAYTSAIKNALITTFLVASGDDPELDENGQQMDDDAIEAAFKDITASLKANEPEKNAHKEQIAKYMAHFHTGSGRPVEHVREFKTKADATSCYKALQILEADWRKAKFKSEAAAGEAGVPKGKK